MKIKLWSAIGCPFTFQTTKETNAQKWKRANVQQTLFIPNEFDIDIFVEHISLWGHLVVSRQFALQIIQTVHQFVVHRYYHHHISIWVCFSLASTLFNRDIYSFDSFDFYTLFFMLLYFILSASLKNFCFIDNFHSFISTLFFFLSLRLSPSLSTVCSIYCKRSFSMRCSAAESSIQYIRKSHEFYIHAL